MPKKTPVFTGRIAVEGNNGGSYVKINEAFPGSSVVELEVGHDCVTRIKQPISVFALAAILTRAKEVGFKKMIEDLYSGDPPPSWAEPY